jgi:hypothetical protein
MNEEKEKATQQAIAADEIWTALSLPTAPLLCRRNKPPIDRYSIQVLQRMLWITFEPESLTFRRNEIETQRQFIVRNMENIGCVAMIWRHDNFPQLRIKGGKHFFIPRMGTVNINVKLIDNATDGLKHIHLHLLPFDYFSDGPADVPTKSEMAEAWEIRKDRRRNFPAFIFPIMIVKSRVPTRA